MITAYTDGACRVSNPGECSCAFAVYDGYILIHSQGFYLGPELHTNNVAEYWGIIKALEWLDSKVTTATIYCDSMLVVNQVNKLWKCNKPELVKLCARAQELMSSGGHILTHVRGHSGIDGNELCDQLCNSVLDAHMSNPEMDASEKFFLDTGKEFAELSPTEQRKLIEVAMEEHSETV